MPPDRFLSPELARRMSELSRQLHRQIGVLVNRRGQVTHVIAGDAQKLFIPDLTRHRAGTARFRGLRLLHTHLRGEGLSQDDLTDLALLRLDAIVVVEAKTDGLPGFVEWATIDPAKGESPWAIERRSTVHGWETDFLVLIEELESRFSERSRSRRTPGAEGVIVIGVATSNPTSAHASLDELERLSETAGLQVLDRTLQIRRKFEPRTVVGKGKLQQILVNAMQLDAGCLVFDQELSPSQLRNIATTTELKVVDRTQLILDIFAQRAKSREGKLQVELAQLRYRKPRLKIMPTAMSRLTGGIGGRGPGETKLEINRRRAGEREARLEKQLKKLSKDRALRRGRRKKVGLPHVAIVGYTNVGKSTLLNRMTHSKVDAEDKLFATLDPTSRRLRTPAQREIILTDTVGFIRNLPKDLIHAFQSTLEEVAEADLLLHIIDGSSADIDTHISAVEATIASLGAKDTPCIRVLNKVDAIEPALWDGLKDRYEGLLISAKKGDGLKDLLVAVERHLFRDKAQATLEP